MTIEAVVRNGVRVPKAPLSLAEGQDVKVQIETETDEEVPLLWLAARAADTGFTDFAEQHDHYIYGTPKRGNR
jgi:predicted DNA-binding antitoxin AbrB/MazE fold protein